MATDTTPVRNDALARASSLANRARELRRAQSEVQDLTAREVQVLARTAAAFFDSIPLAEFTATLMPPTARGLRRIRHRILHRTIHNTEMGTLIRALLLGRDGNLRLFSARSADSRDLLLIMEPGRALPAGVMRDVVDWTPTLRVPGFRPFEILDRLSQSLDSVEEQIEDAEQRVEVQRKALASGDLSALLPGVPAATLTTSVQETAVPMLAAPVAAHAIDATVAAAPLESSAPANDPFNLFDRVEAVAEAAELRPHDVRASGADPVAATPTVASSATAAQRIDSEAVADEWDEPVEPESRRPQETSARSLFPPMPSPR